MECLAFVGACAILAACLSIIMLAFHSIKDLIDKLLYDWRVKHRFDKPPTAKCYCVDCEYYNNESERCYGFHEDSNRLVADCCFCYRAEPRKK